MFDNYQHAAYSHLRRQDILKQVQREQLAFQARMGRRSIRFYHPALAAFGHWLVASGMHLQRRYGALADSARSARWVSFPQPRPPNG